MGCVTVSIPHWELRRATEILERYFNATAIFCGFSVRRYEFASATNVCFPPLISINMTGPELPFVLFTAAAVRFWRYDHP